MPPVEDSVSKNSVPINEPQQSAEPIIQPIRRSQRDRRSAIPSDYVVYMSEDVNIGKVDDPTSYKEAMNSEHSPKSLDAMEEEIKSMSINDVWDLVEIPIKLNMTPKGISKGSKQDL